MEHIYICRRYHFKLIAHNHTEVPRRWGNGSGSGCQVIEPAVCGSGTEICYILYIDEEEAEDNDGEACLDKQNNDGESCLGRQNNDV